MIFIVLLIISLAFLLIYPILKHNLQYHANILSTNKDIFLATNLYSFLLSIISRLQNNSFDYIFAIMDTSQKYSTLPCVFFDLLMMYWAMLALFSGICFSIYFSGVETIKYKIKTLSFNLISYVLT